MINVSVLVISVCLTASLSSARFVKSSESINALDGMSSDPNDVGFFLYTNPSNPMDSDELVYNDISSFQRSKFDPNKKLVIYSSGFLQNRTSDQAIKNAYLGAGFASNWNIVIVDWGKLSGNKSPIPEFFGDLHVLALYNAAKENVYIVGRRMQEMLSFMINNGLVKPENIHLVGQSLGAHVSGMAGLYFRQETGKSIGRITGTDGAAQLFQGVHIDKRLDASDANFVDIIHTNDGGYGYSGAYGTVDFFVNGGKAPQPGCDGTETFCSHNMAVEYFAKSIHDVGQSLRAFDCQIEVCSENAVGISFGEYCPTSAKGSYYINTTPEY